VLKISGHVGILQTTKGSLPDPFHDPLSPLGFRFGFHGILLYFYFPRSQRDRSTTFPEINLPVPAFAFGIMLKTPFSKDVA
jgi:hypothetical protein